MSGEAAPSDNELIAQSLKGGDAGSSGAGASAAFGTLVLRYRKLVLGVAYRLCPAALHLHSPPLYSPK